LARTLLSMFSISPRLNDGGVKPHINLEVRVFSAFALVMLERINGDDGPPCSFMYGVSYGVLVCVSCRCWLDCRRLCIHSGHWERDRERDLRKEAMYCSPAWDCGKGSLV